MFDIIAAGWLSLVDPTAFPDSHLLKGWSESSDIVITRTETPETIRKVSINCPSRNLSPTHPQQYTKEYHYAVWSHYDHGRLKPDSAACERPNPTNRFCVKATYANAVFMSDLYNDDCGNTYRGYWLVSYLQSDESMGTLFAKGRTVYPKPDSEWEGEMITGDTYVTQESEYLLFSAINKTEAEQINMSQRNAIKEGYVRSGLLWKRP
jgi:hypothetical protein